MFSIRPFPFRTTFILTAFFLFSTSCSTYIWQLESVNSVFPQLTLNVDMLAIHQPIAKFQPVFLEDLELIEINVQTNAELCMVGFFLERQNLDKTFESIGQEEVFGDSLGATYTMIDEALSYNEALAYRLKIINQDGTYQYSTVETIFIKKILEDMSLIVHPSQTKQYLEVNSLIESEAALEVFNAKGTSILSKKIDLQRGINWSKLELENVKNGVYFIALKIDGQQWMERLIKLS